MARTTDELLAQLERFVPPELAPYRPLFAGIAAMMRQAELVGDDLVDATKHGSATGIWLTLLAQGYGVRRVTSESDESLLYRLRNVPDALTVEAIETVANQLLAEYTAEECELLEHWDNGLYLDDDAYADIDLLYDEHNAFTLICPLVGDYPAGDAYCDNDAYCDDEAYAGMGTGEHAVYAAIVAAVEQIRASGVRWWLVVPVPP